MTMKRGTTKIIVTDLTYDQVEEQKIKIKEKNTYVLISIHENDIMLKVEKDPPFFI